MEWLLDSEIWVSLVTLTTLEIILGVDNIVVIALLTNKLPAGQRQKARSLGIGLALITRVLLLLSIAWLASLTGPLFSLAGREFSVRDLILVAGGLFLLFKGTHEIHGALETEGVGTSAAAQGKFLSVVIQIMLLDIVFSLDSVITAIGMARQLGVMVAAIVIAMAIMLVASGTIGRFIHRHPSLKILALSFLLMVGVALIAEGLEFHIPKGYIYFAMAFSAFVEVLNLAAGHRRALKKARVQ